MEEKEILNMFANGERTHKLKHKKLDSLYVEPSLEQSSTM